MNTTVHRRHQMPDFFNIKNEFLQQVIGIVEAHLADENFGVAELAEKAGMSRSNLLRKLQKLTGLSVSIFIRQVRLHHAQQMLQDQSLTVSEVSYKVGFNSPSYFIKCFREQYGYPPGEESKRQTEVIPEEPVANDTDAPAPMSKAQKNLPWPRILTGLIVLALVVVFFFIMDKEGPADRPVEKSIAVLPFKNDSSDSTNVYFVNGLMEAVLNNLQKIENLRVVSRTSVEQYRDGAKSIPEIAEELNVSYFVEGSGQKVGDQVILTIQLIEATNDNHLWSERYSRETPDIFTLQAEVAQDIANEIEVIITPEEQRRIEKIPTQNLTAYDYYLKGLELTKEESLESLEKAIEYFKKAIAEDPDFAVPYVSVAICYYYLDTFTATRKYDDEIKRLTDTAIGLDPELADAYLAKGLYYMQIKEYELSEDYFLKVLDYNPNYAGAYIYLAQIYDIFRPNTQKYLTYALRGTQLDYSAVDSATTSLTYMQLGNALIQNGFIPEAEEYLLKAIDYDDNNLFAEYIYAYILMAKDMDLERTKRMLLSTLARDTTRLDVVQEVGKMYYATEEYEMANEYYQKFSATRDLYDIDIFTSEDLKIGFVLQQLGKEQQATRFMESFKTYAEADKTIYHHLSLTAYYAAIDNAEQAIVHLKAFSKESNYKYWYVLVLEDDPIMNRLRAHPQYQPLVDMITDKFWKEHKALRKQLEIEGLI